MTMMKQLIQMSQTYGSNPEYVLGGGGNTSLKEGDVLFVKASGTALATIGEDGFVAIDRPRLQSMWKKQYSPDSARRESEVLSDLMAARREGETGRPSVETTLHDLMEFRFVLHLHPALVNGLTCSQNDRDWVREHLGEDVVWLDATKPGFTLAAACKTLFESYKRRLGACPPVLLIENHGVFFGADSLADMDSRVLRLMDRIRTAAVEGPDLASCPASEDIGEIADDIRSLFPGSVLVHESNRGIRALSDGGREGERLDGPFTPDHIVYCGPYPMYSSRRTLGADLRAFLSTHGFPPKILLIRGAGLFALGKSEKLAGLAKDLFLDEIKILAFSRNFGGPRYMTPEDIDFIVHWEVENYRVKAGQS